VRILVVEDEPGIADALQRGLTADGFAVDVAGNGADGLWMAQNNPYVAIVLDIMLPEMNGLEGLDTGADDYVTKPFRYPVLLARLRALIRRSETGTAASDVLTCGDLRLDPAAHTCHRGETEVELSPKGFAILEYLIRQQGLVVSKDQILENVWDHSFDGNPNIVEVYVSRLRAAIDAPFDRRTLQTVRGVTDAADGSGRRLSAQRFMRLRFTVVALVASLLLLAAATIVLGVVLRSALIDEIDQTLSNRTLEIADELDSAPLDEVTGFSLPLDSDNVVLVLNVEDASDPYVSFLWSESENEPNAAAVLDAVLDADGFVLDEPVSRSIPSLNASFPGVDTLRLSAIDLIETEEIVVMARNLDSVDRTLDRVRNVALLVIPLASLLIAGLVWVLTGWALRPVEAIRREVEDISSTDLARRVPETGRSDEIGRLATTMNGMLGRLDTSTTKQRRFVSDAAHELRSPLASMAAQLDVDLAHPNQANWPETAVRVRGETLRMEGLIEGLLALARHDGNAPARPETLVDLDDAILTEAGLLTSDAVSIDCSGVSVATVRGDGSELRRVVNNLLTNAVRHADERVAVTATLVDDVVVVSFDDDGDGVPEADRELVFDRFVRLDGARARDSGGSGLGLAISREIAVAHGGTLTVGDSPLGGARFTLKLPTV